MLYIKAKCDLSPSCMIFSEHESFYPRQPKIYFAIMFSVTLVLLTGGGRFTGKQCEVCHRTFKYYSTYMHHQAVHRGETTCPVCNRAFSQKQALKKHLLAIHQYVWDGFSRFDHGS